MREEMTQTTPGNPERTSRSPYVGAVAFFLLLIVIGVIALLPKLRHRDDSKGGGGCGIRAAAGTGDAAEGE